MPSAIAVIRSSVKRKRSCIVSEIPWVAACSKSNAFACKMRGALASMAAAILFNKVFF